MSKVLGEMTFSRFFLEFFLSYWWQNDRKNWYGPELSRLSGPVFYLGKLKSPRWKKSRDETRKFKSYLMRKLKFYRSKSSNSRTRFLHSMGAELRSTANPPPGKLWGYISMIRFQVQKLQWEIQGFANHRILLKRRGCIKREEKLFAVSP